MRSERPRALLPQPYPSMLSVPAPAAAAAPFLRPPARPTWQAEEPPPGPGPGARQAWLHRVPPRVQPQPRQRHLHRQPRLWLRLQRPARRAGGRASGRQGGRAGRLSAARRRSSAPRHSLPLPRLKSPHPPRIHATAGAHNAGTALPAAQATHATKSNLHPPAQASRPPARPNPPSRPAPPVVEALGEVEVARQARPVLVHVAQVEQGLRLGHSLFGPQVH